jgi:MoxR-like ATPase
MDRESGALTGPDVGAVNDQVKDASAFVYRLREEVGKVVVGQRYVVDRLLIGLLANGHILLEGVPGLAKTLSVKTLAQAIEATFHRLQFTPDLLPADLIGTLIYNPREGVFTTKRGPIFANVILADEINRAPAKVQSALLEAMQEHQVTIGEDTFPLPSPFLVLATQNPIEQEGTYPLPEAQLDRFMFNVVIDYPTAEEERRILATTTGGHTAGVQPVATGDEIAGARLLVREIAAAENVIDYATRLVRATRPAGPATDQVPQPVRQWVRWGAGPRAGQALVLGAKARALVEGRAAVALDDVRAVAPPVLRHRLLVNFQAEADGVTPDDVVAKILDAVGTR